MPNDTANEISRDVARAIAAKRLTPFEGREVTRCRVEIPSAAGGLREALDFDPVEIGHDQEVCLVMKLRCKKVRFDEVKDSDCLVRVHVLDAIEGEASFVEEAVVEEAIRQQKDRIKRAQEEEAGIIRAFNEDGSPNRTVTDEEPFGHRPEEADGSRSGDDAQDDPTADPGDVGDEWDDEK